MRALALVIVVAIGLLAGEAHAVIVDFDSHASTGSLSGTPPPSAVVTNDYASLGIVFGRTGVSAGSAVVNNSNTFSLPNGACGLDAAGNIVSTCTGDQYFHFVNPSDGVTVSTTNSLSFVVGDAGGDLDSWILHVYDIADVELEARAVSATSNTTQSFAYAGMHRVWIQWTDGPGGYLLDDITFASPASAVPAPAGLVLAAVGLLASAVRRRR